MLIRKSFIALSLVATALSAAATGVDPAKGDAAVVQSIQLKDGVVMHHYRDGKMSMEDKYGRVVYMKEGVSMQTEDGRTIIMKGNEVARLYQEKHLDNKP